MLSLSLLLLMLLLQLVIISAVSSADHGQHRASLLLSRIAEALRPALDASMCGWLMHLGR